MESDSSSPPDTEDELESTCSSDSSESVSADEGPTRNAIRGARQRLKRRVERSNRKNNSSAGSSDNTDEDVPLADLRVRVKRPRRKEKNNDDEGACCPCSPSSADASAAGSHEEIQAEDRNTLDVDEDSTASGSAVELTSEPDSQTSLSITEDSIDEVDELEETDSHKPVCAGSAVSRSTFEALLLAVGKKHKFSKSAKEDVLNLMRVVLPEPNLPSSNYLFEKDLFHDIGIQYKKYQLCSQCEHELVEQCCETQDCPNFELSPPAEQIDTFYIIPLADQLKRVLADNWGNILQYKGDHSHRDGKLRDICCGKLYRAEDGCDDPTKLISLVFHIDGAPAVKSKSMSLWPMQCFVVELPYGLRYSFKNILFCGLWCGRKPSMRVFQSYFVRQIEEAQQLEFEVNESVVTIRKVKVHGHLADLVAKAPSLNMKQFNGEFGCSVCLHPGERLQGRGNVRVYPQYPEEPARRNNRDTLLQAQVAEETGRSVFGIMGTSPLHRVLRVPDNLLLDYMHLVLEGEFMRRLNLWLNGSGNHGYLHEHQGTLEAIMKTIQFPHDFNRKLRPFNEIKRWKDREVQNFFLHVSLPLLRPFLPLEFFFHLCLLVSAIWLLTFDEVTEYNITIAKMLLSHYARLVEVLYGKTQVTYTVHGLQHLPDQVTNFGPLILHSGFVFEAMISHLKRLFHGTRCIPEQIVRNLVMAQASAMIIKANTADERVVSFAQRMTTVKQYNAQRVGEGIHFFNPMQRNPSLRDPVLEAVMLYAVHPNPCIQLSTRMIKNGQIFHSLSYKAKGQSCSYIVQFERDRCMRYGTVVCFLLVNDRPLAAIKLFHSLGGNVSSDLPEPEDEMLRTFHQRGLLGPHFVAVRESEDIELVNCQSLLRRCIFVPSEGQENTGYLCPVLKHYQHD